MEFLLTKELCLSTKECLGLPVRRWAAVLFPAAVSERLLAGEGGGHRLPVLLLAASKEGCSYCRLPVRPRYL